MSREKQDKEDKKTERNDRKNDTTMNRKMKKNVWRIEILEEFEKTRFHILGVTETKRKGRLKNDNLLIYSGVDQMG